MCVTKPVRFRTTIPTFRRGGKATRSPSRRATLPLWRFCPQRGLRPVPPSAPRGANRDGEDWLPPHPDASGPRRCRCQRADRAPAQPERTGSAPSAAAPSAAVSSGAGSYGVGTGRTATFLPSFLVPDLPARAALGGTWPQGPEAAESGGATAGLSRQSPGGGGAHTSTAPTCSLPTGHPAAGTGRPPVTGTCSGPRPSVSPAGLARRAEGRLRGLLSRRDWPSQGHQGTWAPCRSHLGLLTPEGFGCRLPPGA